MRTGRRSKVSEGGSASIRRFLLSIALCSALPAAQAAFSAEKLALIDRPFVSDRLALSSDGRYLAFTQRVDNRQLLCVADLNQRHIRVMPLAIDLSDSDPHRPLAVLRWVGPDRLVLENADGQIAAIDPDGRNVAWLWRRTDNGIRNDYVGDTSSAVAGPPRILQPDPEEPDSIFVESAAFLDSDRLANLYRANVRTAAVEVAHQGAYYSFDQHALYGPGDLIGLPLPPGAVFGVNPDSSSSGMMLYDRSGWPRILYEMNLTKTRRRFSYTEPGRPTAEPDILPVSLNEELGELTLHQETLGMPGEFDVRPENWFGERSYPIAFGYDPQVMYIASNVGRDTFGIYSVNLETRERRELAPEVTGVDLANGDPADSDGILVFDDARRQLVGIRYETLRPRTYWLDPDLAELQVVLDAMVPDHAVEILAWDDERALFVLRVSSESDPGAIYLYRRTEDRLERFQSRAPWLSDVTLNLSAPFDFTTDDGVELSGYLTLPGSSRVDPPPLLIYCAPGLWDRAHSGFNREAEMLADMGFVVMRLNYRGSAGFGRKHVTAIQAGIDTIPVDDFITATRWLASRRPIDSTRIVVMGEGFGGYLALRAVQDHPDIFRAAISLNAPTNLSAWAKPRPARWTQNVDFSAATEGVASFDSTAAADPVATSADSIDGMLMQPNLDFERTYDFRSLVRERFVKDSIRGAADISADVAEGNFRKAVLLISNIHSNDTTPIASLFGGLGLGLQGMTVQRMTISGEFVSGSLETRSRVFQRIEEFLNESLYEFGSEVGELRQVEDGGTQQDSPPGSR